MTAHAIQTRSRTNCATHSMRYVDSNLAWTLMESIPAPLIMVNHANRIRYVNHEAERLFDCKFSEIVDKAWTDVFSFHDQAGQAVNFMPADTRGAQRIPGNEGWLFVEFWNGKEIAARLSIRSIESPDVDHQYATAIVFHDLCEIKQLVDRLLHQCSHDALTGLVNRSEFETRLSRAIESANSSVQVHALLFMDLNNFKGVNDDFGHQAGDALLRCIAKRFRSLVRDRDTLARFGGDEFLLLLEHCDLRHAAETAKILRQALLNAPLTWNEREIMTDVSIGIVMIDSRSPPPTVLISQADAACYVAKRDSQERIRVFHEGDYHAAFMLGSSEVYAYDS